MPRDNVGVPTAFLSENIKARTTETHHYINQQIYLQKLQESRRIYASHFLHTYVFSCIEKSEISEIHKLLNLVLMHYEKVCPMCLVCIKRWQFPQGAICRCGDLFQHWMQTAAEVGHEHMSGYWTQRMSTAHQSICPTINQNHFLHAQSEHRPQLWTRSDM